MLGLEMGIPFTQLVMHPTYWEMQSTCCAQEEIKMVWQTHRNASAIYSFYGDEPRLAGSRRETGGRSSPSRCILLTDTGTVLRDRDSHHVEFLLFKWFRNERVVED